MPYITGGKIIGNNRIYYRVKKHKHNYTDRDVRHDKRRDKWYCDCKYMIFVADTQKICSHIAACMIKEGSYEIDRTRETCVG